MSALYLIPTPISDQDISRVIPSYNLELICGIRHFVVEEIRSARRFLRKAGYTGNFDDVQFYLFNEHNANFAESDCLSALMAGHPMGLMSEAGIPCVADPGYQVVAMAHRHNVQVIPLSGPSSLFMALMASGLPGQSFTFWGYLPVDKTKRLQSIRQMEKEAYASPSTQFCIETPYRNQALFEDLIHVCRAETQLCLATEISGSSENITTLNISAWRKKTIEIHKKTCIFLLAAPQH